MGTLRHKGVMSQLRVSQLVSSREEGREGGEQEAGEGTTRKNFPLREIVACPH